MKRLAYADEDLTSFVKEVLKESEELGAVADADASTDIEGIAGNMDKDPAGESTSQKVTLEFDALVGLVGEEDAQKLLDKSTTKGEGIPLTSEDVNECCPPEEMGDVEGVEGVGEVGEAGEVELGGVGEVGDEFPAADVAGDGEIPAAGADECAGADEPCAGDDAAPVVAPEAKGKLGKVGAPKADAPQGGLEGEAGGSPEAPAADGGAVGETAGGMDFSGGEGEGEEHEAGESKEFEAGEEEEESEIKGELKEVADAIQKVADMLGDIVGGKEPKKEEKKAKKEPKKEEKKDKKEDKKD